MPRFILAFALLSILITGCGPAKTPEPVKNKLPALEGNWTIKMSQSGGIMGLSRKIEIRSNGFYIVGDERTGQTMQGQLAENELAALKNKVLFVDYSPNTKPYGCADCFIYQLDIAGKDGTFSVQLDDISLPTSGLEALVNDLVDIIKRELK
jgi:hypothetical protein